MSIKAKIGKWKVIIGKRYLLCGDYRLDLNAKQ
jgi:hypothetical protein